MAMFFVRLSDLQNQTEAEESGNTHFNVSRGSSFEITLSQGLGGARTD
jgi:hypothetical protein